MTEQQENCQADYYQVFGLFISSSQCGISIIFYNNSKAFCSCPCKITERTVARNITFSLNQVFLGFKIQRSLRKSCIPVMSFIRCMYIQQRPKIYRTGTCEQLIQLLERSKFGIYDFTFTIPELITKLKTSTVKTPLLKKRNLQILFEKQPYCVTTFKALGAEINRKAKQKPQNKLKILNCLIKFLEHAENGGDTEQWMFLSACIKQAMEREPGQFLFQEHLKILGALEAWSTVILGSNIVKLLQQMLRDKNNGVDPDNQKITSMMQVMEISGINSTKLPGIQKFIEQQFPQ